MPKNIRGWMDTQEAWSRKKVSESNGNDAFFRHVGYVLRQFDGLEAGYRANKNVPVLDHWAFQMLNGVGDMFDILPTVDEDHRTDWASMTKEDIIREHSKAGHCSAMIKLTGNFSDLFIGHSSWWTFSNTNRIFKHYHFDYNDNSTAARKISFSSYPGFLESLDDFYMLGSGLAWTQTTNPVIDHSVYKHVKPESLLAWQRVRVASAMAHTGKEWYQALKREYSGTYENQYMVVDFNLYKPNQPIADNTLWVIEEMPGLVVGRDQTSKLRLGYWPSYNVPYYREIFKRSGYVDMEKKHGNFFTYSLAPRGELFRRDQGEVSDLKSFEDLMRSNDYKTDPYSFDGKVENPLYAICSRGDLSLNGSEPTGCYDTKVSSYNFGVLEQKAQIINGPTSRYSGNNLPAFTWDEFPERPHMGLPHVYEFDFIVTKPASVEEEFFDILSSID
uniref:Phospholipase B-like n=1 Tax=Mucochytrium quahogii TaxID=96639 RepID=A0A7S2S049_9STRA|mmetsp:Transcript_22726/g.49419  ORF Transcript_22726/g.49419 Transcript_22726/m.49419 type:complete len:445 (+) Transcript_22726:877-2211(+)